MNEITRTCSHCKAAFKITYAAGKSKITIYCPNCSKGGEVELATISASGEYSIEPAKVQS